MAKTVEQILKEQLGSLMLEVAILNSTISIRDDEIAALKKVLEETKPNVRLPDKQIDNPNLKGVK